MKRFSFSMKWSAAKSMAPRGTRPTICDPQTASFNSCKKLKMDGSLSVQLFGLTQLKAVWKFFLNTRFKALGDRLRKPLQMASNLYVFKRQKRTWDLSKVPFTPKIFASAILFFRVQKYPRQHARSVSNRFRIGPHSSGYTLVPSALDKDFAR